MLIEHQGKRPTVHPTAYVAPNAVLSGDVTIGEGTVILFGAVLSADGGPVRIGADCVVMENAVVRGTPRHPVELGNRVLVGPHAHLSGCSVGDEVFLATGVAVFNGVEIADGVEVRINGIVHVNSLLEAGTTVPIGWIAVGRPAKLFPPNEHDAIWEVQQKMDFPGTVFGMGRETPKGERTRRYAASLRDKHRNDDVL